jgi:TatA/E family protein of Tat protein translocase
VLHSTRVDFANPTHIAFLLVLVLLVFGAKRLPELGRSLGSVMHEFTRGVARTDGPPHAASLPASTGESRTIPSSPGVGDDHQR